VRVFLVAACAAVGAWVGALAPCLVYRLAVPAGVAPRDTCPHCQGLLPAGWRGWVRPSGRCPACHAVLTAHPWVWAAVSAAVFAALGWRLPIGRPADVALAVAWLSLGGAGIVLAGIDLRVNRLPRPIIVAAACVLAPLVVVAAVCAGDPGLLVRSAGAAVVFGAVYLALALTGPGLVGLGDVYLATLVGLMLGTGPVAAILAGALLPYLLAAPITLVRLIRQRIRRADHIAWGPYLVLGAIIAKALIPL
jgi:leader peptidase (prepilin peptidase)/N-methyltransferase